MRSNAPKCKIAQNSRLRKLCRFYRLCRLQIMQIAKTSWAAWAAWAAKMDREVFRANLSSRRKDLKFQKRMQGSFRSRQSRMAKSVTGQASASIKTFKITPR